MWCAKLRMRGIETPYLSDLDKILQDGTYPRSNRRNHLCKFWWRSVKGFSSGGGRSNFALLHWLWSSSLQHSRTTVRVCDTIVWLLHVNRGPPPMSIAAKQSPISATAEHLLFAAMLHVSDSLYRWVKFGVEGPSTAPRQTFTSLV